MHATTMKTKRHYTAPVTQRATVELEGGFCGSVVSNPMNVNTTGHEINEVELGETGEGNTLTHTWNDSEWK